MRQMKEWFFKFVLQTLWRRRKWLYYALSVASIAGNLVVFIGPSLQASTVLRNIEASQLVANWGALPQAVAEVILHRFVLNILLNLIVARIVVKSGMLGRTAGMPVLKQLDDLCLPLSSSSYSLRCGWPWPPSSIHTTCAMPSASPVQPSMDPSKPLPCLDHGDVKQMSVASTKQVVCVSGHIQTRPRPHTSFMKRRDDENTKCSTLAPSLFTIEPLEELVRSTENSPSLLDDRAHSPKTLQHPLRKVMSRATDLHRSSTEKRYKDSEKPEHLQHQKEEQSLELASQDVDFPADDGNDAAEDDDNSLSRQEFNERVSNFIVKFKRNLTMQRQDSLTRLLGLVGGGGDIRLFK